MRWQQLFFYDYPDYRTYKKNIGDKGLYEMSKEQFKSLYGVYEISEEDYNASPNSTDVTNEKILYDFGKLPIIEADIDAKKLVDEVLAKKRGLTNEDKTLDELPWSEISYSRVFTDNEMKKMRLEYQAKDMDAKWNLYFEGNDLIMERSWTKTPVFKLSFADNKVKKAQTKFQLSDESSNKSYANMIDEVLNMFFEGMWDNQ